MPHSTIQRGLAVLGVTGVLFAAAPAMAQAQAPELLVHFPDTSVAAETAGKIVGVVFAAAEEVAIRDVVSTYEVSGLAGVAVVSHDGSSATECTSPSADTLVCTSSEAAGIPPGGGTSTGPGVLIAPVPGAVEGAAGTMEVTVEAAGLAPVTREVQVRVGEGVNLAAGPETEITARFGTAFTAPLSVTNAGETAAEGATVLFINDYGIRAGTRYSNCTYVEDDLRSCSFDQTLEPGLAYDATLAYKLAPDTEAPGLEGGDVIWFTPAEFEDFAGTLAAIDVPLGEPGDGDELELAEVAALRAGRVQVDTEPTNDTTFMSVRVTGSNPADLAAVGDTVTGARGTRVTATVGVTNKGPATVDSGRSGEPFNLIDVRVPPGTTAVAVPPACAPVVGDDVRPDRAGEPGARRYVCETGTFLLVGQTLGMDFRLRVDTATANATGTVQVNAGPLSDPNPANDTAKIVVNPTSAGGGGAGGGTDDDGLPITGAPVTTLVTVGLLLLVGGGAAVLAGRRRRT
jgi:hypothetical protein